MDEQTYQNQINAADTLPDECEHCGHNANDDGWTYCDDRLPEEKYKYYLVTRKTGDVAISPFGTNGFDLAHVIAWRPLPEPAKGRDV